MDEKVKFPSNMILIDTASLNLVIMDLKKYFERTLKRELQEIDFSGLITHLVSDSGIAEGENQVQILVVYDKNSVRLSNCVPSDSFTEPNDVASKSQFGESSFTGVPCEGMVSREELYLDSLNIVVDSADMRRLTLVFFNEEYGDKVMNRLRKIKNKKTAQFRVNEPEETPEGHRWEMSVYPLM